MQVRAVGVFAVIQAASMALAQSGAVIPQGGAGHAAQASCVILKRMGPADQVTSHLYSFGIRGKQFQYIEGKLPEGFPFHGRLTDHDVRNLQGRGAEVIIVNSSYTSDELKQARDDCRGETGKSPNQAEPKPAQTASSMLAVPSSQEVPAASNTANDKPTASQQNAQPAATKLSVVSMPSGADIDVDGAFVGNTPSTVDIQPGEHMIMISKTGYKSWERKMRVSGGDVNLNAELEAAKQ
jgi:PEGA domain